MSDILDLDALAPQPKKVKISGKIIDCYPPRVRQLITMEAIWTKIQNSTNAEEGEQLLMDALAPIVPAIREDKDIDFSMDQLTALLFFAQNMTIPDSIKDKNEAITTPTSQKKTD